MSSLRLRGRDINVFYHKDVEAEPRNSSEGRPATMGGVSLKGGSGTRGATLGAIVLDRSSKAVMALSNNHVWDVKGWSPPAWNFGRVTRVALRLDAAVARVHANREVSYEIEGIPGGIHGMVDPRLGMLVAKTGKATGTTYGYIEGISADEFSVTRLPGKKRELTKNDDSGSVWIEVESGAAVGLHWGGELSNEPECAFAHWMTRIAQRLRIDVSRRTTWKGRTSVGPGVAAWEQRTVVATPRSAGRLTVQAQGDPRWRVPEVRYGRSAPKTKHSVATVAWGQSLVMAWVDRRTQEIHLATSRKGGTNRSAATRFGERTRSTPALAVVGDKVALAWRDVRTQRIRISFSLDGRRWTNGPELPFTTTSGPALAAMGTRLIVAWRDARSDAIRVTAGSERAIQRSRPTRLRFKTQARPALQQHAGCLYLAWTSSENGRLHLASSHDGRRWSDPPLAMHDTAIDGPALASQGHDLIWAWTDPTGKVISLRTER